MATDEPKVTVSIIPNPSLGSAAVAPVSGAAGLSVASAGSLSVAQSATSTMSSSLSSSTSSSPPSAAAALLSTSSSSTFRPGAALTATLSTVSTAPLSAGHSSSSSAAYSSSSAGIVQSVPPFPIGPSFLREAPPNRQQLRYSSYQPLWGASLCFRRNDPEISNGVWIAILVLAMVAADFLVVLPRLASDNAAITFYALIGFAGASAIVFMGLCRESDPGFLAPFYGQLSDETIHILRRMTDMWATPKKFIRKNGNVHEHIRDHTNTTPQLQQRNVAEEKSIASNNGSSGEQSIIRVHLATSSSGGNADSRSNVTAGDSGVASDSDDYNPMDSDVDDSADDLVDVNAPSALPLDGQPAVWSSMSSDPAHPSNDPSLVCVEFCKRCRIWRPPRAAHCSMCEVCVLRYDHHCGVIGACIGKSNHRFFFLFLAAAGIGGMLCLASTVVWLTDLAIDDGSAWHDWQPYIAIFLLFIYLYVGAVFVFCVGHCVMLIGDVTTKERFGRRQKNIHTDNFLALLLCCCIDWCGGRGRGRRMRKKCSQLFCGPLTWKATKAALLRQNRQQADDREKQRRQRERDLMESRSKSKRAPTTVTPATPATQPQESVGHEGRVAGQHQPLQEQDDQRLYPQ